MDVDEAFFVHDTVSSRKYWSPRGERIVVPYTGSHQKIVVYGAIAKDGRQLFRTHGWFDAPTFIRYLKEMQKRFGKVAAVTDRASPHRAKLVKGLLRENKNIRIIYLPKGSRTSTRLRNAGTKENGFCLSQNITGRLQTCAMQSSRTTEL